MIIPGYVYVVFTDGTFSWVDADQFCRLDPATVRSVRFDSDGPKVDAPIARPL